MVGLSRIPKSRNVDYTKKYDRKIRKSKIKVYRSTNYMVGLSRQAKAQKTQPTTVGGNAHEQSASINRPTTDF